MNILYINTRFVGGGAEKVARQLFYGLKRKNVETYFLAGVGKKSSGDYKIIHNSIKAKVYNFMKSKIANNSCSTDAYARRKIIQYVKENNIDIVHFHNVHGNYMGIEDIEEIQKYCRVVWTLHDMWILTGHCAYSLNCNKWILEGCKKCINLTLYPKMYFDNAKNIFQLKEKKFSNTEITFVSPSNWLRKLCKNSYLKNYDIKLINNGIDINKFYKHDKKKIRDKFKIPIDKNVLLFSAGDVNNPYKGFGILIKALNFLENKQNYILVIVGNGKIEELNLEFQIWNVGRIDNDSDLNELYAVADLFIMPSIAENYPCSILESFASGTPVIASDVGGISEQITEDTGWLVKELDEKKLCQSIENAFADKTKLSNMRNNCRMVAEKYFSEEKMLNEYYNLYCQIL